MVGIINQTAKVISNKRIDCNSRPLYNRYWLGQFEFVRSLCSLNVAAGKNEDCNVLHHQHLN